MAAHSGGAFPLARRARGALRRVPVWTWRLLMRSVSSRERARFNTDPVTEVAYVHDLDYVGDGLRAHHLDVLTPLPAALPPLEGGAPGGGKLPVYVYFHGGGWTSGDKSALTSTAPTRRSAAWWW